MEENRTYRLVANRNSNFKPVRFRVQGRKHYQIFLSIASDEDPKLQNVQLVQYELHKSFKERLHISRNRSNNFQIEIKAWGTFVVKFFVHLNDSQILSFKEDYGEVLEDVEL